MRERDTHQHHFEKRAVFAGRGVRAVGVKGTGNRKRGTEDDEGL